MKKPCELVSLTEHMAEARQLHPDTIESIERLLAEAKRGTIVAVGVAFAFRENGGTTRWQTLECEDGQHVYLLGLCHRLAHQATIKSLNASEPA